MSLKYIPPRNEVGELLGEVPFDSELYALMKEEIKKIDPSYYSDSDDEAGTWPNVPYHYGMGRIKAYEEWLDGLSEGSQKAEIAACRVRYETHYHTVADALVKRMKEIGYDLAPLRTRSQK